MSQLFDDDEFRKLLLKSRKEPINFAFGLGKGPANHEMAFHRKKSGKPLFGMLKKEAEGVTKGTWGTATSDAKSITLNIEKEVPSLYKHVKLYLKNKGYKIKPIIIGPDGIEISGGDADGDAPDNEANAALEGKVKATLQKLGPVVKKLLSADPSRKAKLLTPIAEAKKALDNGDPEQADAKVKTLIAALKPVKAKASVAVDEADSKDQSAGQEEAYKNKLKEVESVYLLAVKKEKQLKSAWKKATSLADAGDYAKAIVALDSIKSAAEAKLSGGYGERLAEVDPIYNVVVLIKPRIKEHYDKQAKLAADKKYLEAVDVLDSIAEAAPKLINEAVKSWRTAESKSGEQIKFCRDLTASDDVALAKQGTDLMKQYESAKEAARSQDYPKAQRELSDVVAKAKELMKNADRLKESVRDETRKAAKDEKAAYDFASKIDDKEWGFDTNRDAMEFMLGLSTSATGEDTHTKSDTLREMEKALTAAIERKNKLVKSGVNPVEAGEIAFRNIPRNFWPPSVVREMAMYERARAQIEAEEQANDLKKEAESGIGENFSSMVTTSSKVAKKVHSATKGGIKALEKTGGMAKEQAEEVTAEVGGFFGGFGAVMQVGDALGSGITAGEKEYQRRQVDFDPVREQILEFERNRAIVEMINKLTDAALNSIDLLMKVMLDCKIISGVKDVKAMAIAAAEAGRYFRMLKGTNEIRKGAKADPETMSHLALKQRMKDMTFDGSEKAFTAVDKFVNACAKFTGEAVKYGGGQAAPAGFVIAQGGKLLTYSGKPVFKVWGWSKKRDEKKALKAAAAKPPDYKAIDNVFKNSRKYARFALAYAAVEDKDPWARSFIIKRGLTDDMLDHPATSTAIVREYLMVTYEGVSGATQVDTKPKKEGKADKAMKALKGVSAKTRDKLVGRDTGITYKAGWKPSVTSLTLTAWNQTREEAIAAGWYDDRGSHAKAFALYEKAWFDLHKNIKYAVKNKSITLLEKYDRKVVENFTADALAASGELRKTLSAIPTLANDKKTVHAGMKFYTAAAYKLLGDREDEIWRVREAAFDQQLPDDEEERAKVKQEMLESAEKKMRAEIAKQAQQREAMVLKAWHAHKCKTPYGSHKLVDFPAAAVKKLNLDDTAQAALIDDVAGLDRACMESLFEAMSGWGDVSAPAANMLEDLKEKIPGLDKNPARAYQQAFDKEIARQLKQLDTNVNLALRDICAVQFKANQDRLGPDAKKSDKTYSHTTRNLDMTGAAWETVKDEFEKDGWKRYSTGIAKVYKGWEKAHKEWESLPSDLRYQGTWRATCTTLRKKYEALDPATDLGFSHPGMQRYRDDMIDRIQQRYDVFKARCNEVGRPDVPAGWQPDHPNTIPFSERGWKGLRDEAKKHDWNGKSPGFSKHFKAFEKARNKWNTDYRSDDEAVIKKRRAEVLKTLEALRSDLMGYRPKNKKDRPHAGLTVYTQAMLKKADDYLELAKQENPNCLLPGL